VPDVNVLSSNRLESEPTDLTEVAGPAPRRRPPLAGRRLAARVALYLCLAAVVVLSLAPMLWVVSTSLKTTAEVFAPDVSWIPRSPTLDNFQRAVTEYPLVAWLTNSVVIAFWTIVLSCFLHIMAAYALAKLQFPFKRLMLVTLLATIMIPRELTSVPVYRWVRDWGLMDTHAAVYLPQVAEAITVFLLVQFFRSLPDELIEAARLDGASHWTILWKIFVPLARPAIAVVVILSFVNSWNSFFWPLLVTFSDSAVPLPVGLASIMASASEASAARQYGLLMAISLIASIPTMAIFLILQRQFVAAVTSTGLKG
jgi:ABC-type glycerol-3-phosphate transport system permease component